MAGIGGYSSQGKHRNQADASGCCNGAAICCCSYPVRGQWPDGRWACTVERIFQHQSRHGSWTEGGAAILC